MSSDIGINFMENIIILYVFYVENTLENLNPVLSVTTGTSGVRYFIVYLIQQSTDPSKFWKICVKRWQGGLRRAGSECCSITVKVHFAGSKTPRECRTMQSFALVSPVCSGLFCPLIQLDFLWEEEGGEIKNSRNICCPFIIDGVTPLQCPVLSFVLEDSLQRGSDDVLGQQTKQSYKRSVLQE